MITIAPNLAPKVVILEDTMSNVAGLKQDFYDYVETIYQDAIKLGVRTAKSTDF